MKIWKRMRHWRRREEFEAGLEAVSYTHLRAHET